MFLVKVKMKHRQRKVGGDVKAVMGEREKEREETARRMDDEIKSQKKSMMQKFSR